MTSKDLTVETDFAKVVFSSEEAMEINRITEVYSELYKKAVSLQAEIENNERTLIELAKEMEEVKTGEQKFFQEIATRLDLEPNTVANAAANLVLSKL